MRIIGIVLVLFGAVALGREVFASVTTNKADNISYQGTGQQENTVWVPPVLSGIALVTGLIVLASSGRRQDNGAGF